MPKLKTLKIKNFQSHKDSQIDFHSGVTIISGKSDHGKTSLFRAFRLLVQNRPGGLDFKFDKAEKGQNVEVEVTASDGTVYKRIKGSITNCYVVNDQEFMGGGLKIPDEVVAGLNIGELNLQSQLDNHFLVCSPPGQIAKFINKIVDLQEIQEFLKQLTTSTNSIRKEIVYVSDDKAKLLVELEEYSDLDYFAQKIAKHKNFVGDLELRSCALKEITDICASVIDIDCSVAEYSTYLDAKVLVNQLSSQTATLGTLNSQKSELEEVLFSLQAFDDEENEYNQVQDQGISVQKLHGFITQLSDGKELLSSITVGLNEQVDIIQQQQQLDDHIDKLSQSILESKVTFKKELERQGQCLTCGQQLTDAAVTFMISGGK